MLKKKKEKNIKEDVKKVKEDNIEESKEDVNPPKRKKRKKLLIISILILVSLLFGVYFITNSNEYSTDQMKVLSAFSEPQSFVITVDPETGTVVEAWHYLALGETFTFVDGEFSHREHSDFSLDENIDGFNLTFGPKYFYNLTNISEINRLLKTEPTTEGEIDGSVLGGVTKFYSYDNWLYVGELDQEIVYIAKNTQLLDPSFVDSEPTDVTEDLSDYVFVNDVYGYSFKMGIASERIYETTIDFGQDYDSFMYCYVSNNAEDDEYCGSDAYPIFSIDVMDEDQYQENIIDSPFGDLYVELGSSNEYHFMYSHPNGDLPSDAPDSSFHEMVVNSFESVGE